MDSILVSVIMANYQTKIEYLREAIDSILNQTYRNFELIIIDDCSQDESVEYIKTINDNRVKLLINEINSGPAVARNKGLDIAKGKYIAIMDSDDISLPTRLDKQVAYMENHPEIVVCGAWFEKFGVENTIRKPIMDDFELYRCQLLFSNTPNTLCHSTAMIRKSVLDYYGIRYDQSLPKAQDYGMWVVCSKFAKINVIKEVLLRYRTHPKQISIDCVKEQMVLADLISRRQLQELGIDYCEEENKWRYDLVKTKNEYLCFFSWIERIKLANEQKGMFDTVAMNVYLDNKLKNAIKRLKLIEKIKILLFSNYKSRYLFFFLTKASLKKRIKREK